MLDVRLLVPPPLRRLVRRRAPGAVDAYFRFQSSPGQHVKDHVRVATRNVVQAGPFAGMRFPTGTSWGSVWDIVLKLHGTYEQELHAPIEEIRSREYAAIVDIGSADGFYAVGLATFFPKAIVYAFDINPAARQVPRIAAGLNSVAERVRSAKRVIRRR